MTRDPGLRLVLRADATPAAGAGHAMRLATLGEAWRRAGHGTVSLWGEVTLGFVRERFAALGVAVTPWEPALEGAVLVVDHYDSGVRERLGGRARATRRVLVDDLGGPVPGGYDAVWNPNPYASAGCYDGYSGKAIAGPWAVPIRAGLPAWEARHAGTWTGVLLGGGAIPSDLAGAVRCLTAGGAGGTGFRGAGAWVPEHWGRLDPCRPWASLSTAARLLTAAGSTTWEAAAVGIPVALVEVAPNQAGVSRWARAAGVPVVRAGQGERPEGLAAALRDALAGARPLPRLHDGSGEVARLIAQDAGARRAGGVGLQLRPADAADARLLWVWANEAATRDASFGRAPIPWAEHRRWLARRLRNPAGVLLIADEGGRPVGSIRFDTEDGWRTARVSYVVAPAARSRGLSRVLLDAGVRYLEGIHRGARVRAQVMAGNGRSLSAFRRLGWREAAAGPAVVEFEWPR